MQVPEVPGRSMKGIAEAQDKIGWRQFTEGRVAKGIRHMQAAYMGDRDSTHTVDHWMRDLIKYLLTLSHEQWLARNLMKHHHTKGMLAI